MTTKELKPGEKCPHCGQIAPITDRIVPAVLILLASLIVLGTLIGLHILPIPTP